MSHYREKKAAPTDQPTAPKQANPEPVSRQTHDDGEQTLIPTPPSLSADYQFIREIGHGSQAHIYLAKRLRDDKLVSVKQLNIGSVKTWKEYELFHREADVLQTLNIDGVAKFYDAIDCLEDTPPASYIVQEYIEGTSLAEIIQSGHRLKVNDVYEIIIQMLHILMQLHTMTPPVIHRDIKPSNIMISPYQNGRFKVTIIDFGAVANPQVQSGGSTVAGTFGYMPPEQLTGKPVPASDIYALAAVAVELFTGKSPGTLPTKDFRLIFEPEMEQMPPELLNTLRKMLEPNIKERLFDIPLLIQTFTQYQNKNFKAQSDNKTSEKSSKGYDLKLKKIESVGESGNMDLWQELSDSSPRVIPNAILQYFSELADNDSLAQSDKNPNTKRNNPFSKLIMALFILCGFSLLCSFSVINPITFSMGVPLLILFFFMIYYTQKSHHEATDEHFDDNPSQSGQESAPIKIYPKTIFDIIRDGRKTVATITAIEYVPISQNQAKYLPLNDICLCYTQPCFKITYKFNPPDDAREEDLIHEYITHADPQFNCKVGDPLPILYLIDKTESTEIVKSMPFPFPIKDSTPQELVFASSPLYENKAI